MDRDEPRFSEASREMRERGDWILPTFNNAPRYDKPPLTYWCQMLFYNVFGENDFAARFHSALFTALTALVVYGFAARLYGDAAAWRAALAFTLSLQVMVQAKAAVADMPMIFFVALATWAGWELLTRPSRKWWWIFYGALAFGFLAKGPVAWLPIVAILVHAKWQRVQGLNRAFKFQYGVPLMLLVVAAWGVPALVKTHGEFFAVGIGKHVLQRSFAPMEGHGGSGALTYFATLPLYFLTFFASFFPWSIFSRPIYSRIKTARSAADAYLLCGAGVVFVVFTLVKTKLPHYTLPAFPMLACLAAPHLATLRASLFSKLAAAMLALNLAISFLLFPFAANHFLVPIKQISESLHMPPETEFASVIYDEPSQIWYFRKHLKTWHLLLEPKEVEAFLGNPGPRICVLPTEMARVLSRRPGWEEKDFAGKDIANGKYLSLTLITKTTAR